MTEEDLSNYCEASQTVRGLHTRPQAEALRELTLRGLKKLRQEEDHILRVEERQDGTFDLIVLKRIN
jgi:hypothetical protein